MTYQERRRTTRFESVTQCSTELIGATIPGQELLHNYSITAVWVEMHTWRRAVLHVQIGSQAGALHALRANLQVAFLERVAQCALLQCSLKSWSLYYGQAAPSKKTTCQPNLQTCI